MAQEFVYPKSEIELQSIQDEMYRLSNEAYKQNKRPIFKGLIEIISSEAVILTAIHNIKANKGSKTAGSDGKTIREDFLHHEYNPTVKNIQEQITSKNYKPSLIRRVWIPKEGKKEKRPLGIPTIEDRIIQECIRIVIEPIFEAQFFNHSYGFRPMRDASMALERTKWIVHTTGYHWIIEGDISKYFDTVNHNVLLKRMKLMGLRDERLLMLVKKLLKAGIMNEQQVNKLGTPQGGILSPLLANIYLNAFDQWICKQWETKKTRHTYTWGNRNRALKTSRLQPAYLIRYADDWVLVTKSRDDALKWKQRISQFLSQKLKLTLSEEKTVITNIRKNHINFLGYKYKVIKGKSQKGYISRTSPNMERVKKKVKVIHRSLKVLNRITCKNSVIHHINLINSQIRGLVNYYEPTNMVNVVLAKFSYTLNWTGFNSLEHHKVDWIPANKTNNLTSVHASYTTNVPAIKVENLIIGITNIGFCKFKEVPLKNPRESPFSKEGRALYSKRTSKKPINLRADDLLSINLSKLIAEGKTKGIYNFEYFLNRSYAFNRDKGKCRICAASLDKDIQIHHLKPYLPMDEVNRVNNLASLHEECHKMIHNVIDYSFLGKKIWSKIEGFREKLSEHSIY